MGKVAGLTGGIATGKTTVDRMFEEMGIHIIDADKIARDVVKKGMPAWKSIKEEFGDEFLRKDGEIDREKLGKLVFSSKEKRERLNQLVHPFVKERILNELEEALSSGKDVILDVPLLFETGLHNWLRPVILVYAPEEVQVERLIKRERITKEEAMERIKAQMPIEEKKALADFIIDNSGDLAHTKKQVLKVYKEVFKK